MEPKIREVRKLSQFGKKVLLICRRKIHHQTKIKDTHIPIHTLSLNKTLCFEKNKFFLLSFSCDDKAYLSLSVSNESHSGLRDVCVGEDEDAEPLRVDDDLEAIE